MTLLEATRALRQMQSSLFSSKQDIETSSLTCLHALLNAGGAFSPPVTAGVYQTLLSHPLGTQWLVLCFVHSMLELMR